MTTDGLVCKDVKLSPDAFFLIVGKVLVYSLAPLMSLPFLTDSCIIPHIEKLLGKDAGFNLKSGKGKSTNFVGNRGKVVRWLDMLWAFLEVSCIKKKKNKFMF